MPEETAKITFTSGSTGTPKGVCLSAGQMAATAQALQERLDGVELQQHLCILPLATLLENIAGVYLPLLMGATVTVAPLQTLGMTGSSGLELGQLVAGLNQHQPHSVILVPELAMALVNAAEQGSLDTDSFRFLAVGGARVIVATRHPERLEKRACVSPVHLELASPELDRQLQQLTEVYPDIDGVIHCAGSWRIPRCRWCTWPPGRPPQP